MSKMSRYMLVLMTVLAAAVSLPALYWLAFEKPVSAPFILYSASENDFIILRHLKGEVVRTDRKGTVYTREDYEKKLPLFFARQLFVSGSMPDSLHGKAMEMQAIAEARSSFRYRPSDMRSPKPGLYPMFESASGRARLELPDDYFRIDARMEFIDAESNTLNEAKSQAFTEALNKQSFQFPATMVAGLPTTRKSCDEGYFIVDSQNELFHVKMIGAAPSVRKISPPKGLPFKHIACVDFPDKKYYCYLISADNSVWILSQDDYEFVRLPLDGLVPETDELRIFGNMFNYTLSMRRQAYIKVVALDSLYRKVDEYEEHWRPRAESIQGRIAGFLFPAEIGLARGNSRFLNLYVERTRGFNFLFLHLLLLVIQFFIIRKTGLRLRNNLTDLLIVAVCGLYGFIAVNFFQNRFFD